MKKRVSNGLPVFTYVRAVVLLTVVMGWTKAGLEKAETDIAQPRTTRRVVTRNMIRMGTSSMKALLLRE